jgi:hypothetical protein
MPRPARNSRDYVVAPTVATATSTPTRAPCAASSNSKTPSCGSGRLRHPRLFLRRRRQETRRNRTIRSAQTNITGDSPRFSTTATPTPAPAQGPPEASARSEAPGASHLPRHPTQRRPTQRRPTGGWPTRRRLTRRRPTGGAPADPDPRDDAGDEASGSDPEARPPSITDGGAPTADASPAAQPAHRPDRRRCGCGRRARAGHARCRAGGERTRIPAAHPHDSRTGDPRRAQGVLVRVGRRRGDAPQHPSRRIVRHLHRPAHGRPRPAVPVDRNRALGRGPRTLLRMGGVDRRRLRRGLRPAARALHPDPAQRHGAQPVRARGRASPERTARVGCRSRRSTPTSGPSGWATTSASGSGGGTTDR